MKLTFSGVIWHWRGPAPHHFVSVPEAEAAAIADVATGVTYGWGMIPVEVRLGSSTWTTSLWPKDGGYIVPLKKAVRVKEKLDVDDEVTITLLIGEG